MFEEDSHLPMFRLPGPHGSSFFPAIGIVVGFHVEYSENMAVLYYTSAFAHGIGNKRSFFSPVLL